MPYVCPYCRTRVPEDGNSISCDYCRKWCHLQCTDLSESQFEIFSKDKSFEWACSKCVTNICNKCNILTKDNTKIKCDKCNQNYHLRCAGLSKTAFIPTTMTGTTIWYCYQCQEDIFPFNNISVKQISNLSFNSLSSARHPNQLRSIHSTHTQNDNQEPTYSNKCNVPVWKGWQLHAEVFFTRFPRHAKIQAVHAKVFQQASPDPLLHAMIIS